MKRRQFRDGLEKLKPLVEAKGLTAEQAVKATKLAWQMASMQTSDEDKAEAARQLILFFELE